MTVQQLIYFREVARTLHFTKAAQNLYVTQSALSYSISGLERELDVPLFIRESGKNVELTSFGKALLPMAEQVLSCFNDIESTIRQLRNPLSGVVNVAYSYINGNRFVPKMFSQFYRENPNIEISFEFLINHSRTHFEGDVSKGELDLAFSCTPNTEGLEVVPFARQELFVYMAPDHPLAVQDSVSLADIKDEAVIGYDQGRNLDRRINDIFAEAGCKPNVSSYASDWTTSLSLVALGKGICIFPRLPFEPELIKLMPLDHPLHIRDVYMMWPSNRKLSPAVEYVRDYCLDFFGEPPLI